MAHEGHAMASHARHQPAQAPVADRESHHDCIGCIASYSAVPAAPRPYDFGRPPTGFAGAVTVHGLSPRPETPPPRA